MLKVFSGGEQQTSRKTWLSRLNPKRIINKLLDKVLGGVIKFLKNNIRIPEHWWNPEHKKYKGNLEKVFDFITKKTAKLAGKFNHWIARINKLIKKVEGSTNFVTRQAHTLLVSIRNVLNVFARLTGGFSTILESNREEILGVIHFFIGMLSGLWNGLIDLIAGLLGLLQLLIKGLIGAGELADKIASNPQGYLGLFLEYLDNIVQAFQQFSFEGVWEAIQKGFKGLKEAIQKALSKANAGQVGYFVGYLAFNILEFFIPITKLAKVKSVSKVFSAATSLQNGVAKASGMVVSAGTDFLKGLENFALFLQQGAEGIKEMIGNIFVVIRRWLDELGTKSKEAVDKVRSKIQDLLSKDKKTDELFRKIEKKHDLAGKKILSKSELKSLRITLKRIGVEFTVVNRNLSATKALWKSMVFNPKGRSAAFFRPKAGYSRKHKMSLNGPALYVLDEVTPYTIAHELQHVKLWYQMNKRFPELAEEYTKISTRVHEEFVLSGLVKKTSKWDIKDLTNDLKFVNAKREDSGLPRVDLSYFKNWKLSDQIKQL